MDLRWQRADKPVGFHGLKEGIVMRTSEDSNYVINWKPFDNVNRAAAAHTDCTDDKVSILKMELILYEFIIIFLEYICVLLSMQTKYSIFSLYFKLMRYS